MRLVSVVGARPQFVKLAVVCRALAERESPGEIEHLVIHTGQHYDLEMSDVFFRELGIPEPLENLGIGSATHAVQTAECMKRLECALARIRADWVLVYGDTNSTLAGALVVAKLRGVRLAHLESGLRSFNRAMPEEVNRIVVDHLSDLLLCPTTASVSNLVREGLESKAVLTGDVMLDAFLAARDTSCPEPVAGGPWRDSEFALATIHRQENTDNGARLRGIVQGLEEVARDLCPVILPLHPRTAKAFETLGWRPTYVQTVRPVSYREMVDLESRARMIFTDSGGVQKEAYFAACPCVTVRDETEWTETLVNGCNVLVGADPSRIVDAARASRSAGPWAPLYGDGRAGQAVVSAIASASYTVGGADTWVREVCATQRLQSSPNNIRYRRSGQEEDAPRSVHSTSLLRAGQK